MRGLKKAIESFHMMSQLPYWCSKTMKWWPCWCFNKSCGNWTLFLSKRFLLFQWICTVDAVFVSEKHFVGALLRMILQGSWSVVVLYCLFCHWWKFNFFHRFKITAHFSVSLKCCLLAQTFILIIISGSKKAENKNE